MHAAIDEIANLYRAKSEINYIRASRRSSDGTRRSRSSSMTPSSSPRGTHSVEDTEQSLGGEDFSWYLEHVPGAMARLGVRTPGQRTTRDLHRGDFDADESAITVGVELFTAAALLDAIR